MKRLKAHHVFDDPSYETMILLKCIVEIFGLKNFNQLTHPSDLQDVIYSLRTSPIGSNFINDCFVRNAISCDGIFKELPCRAEISALEEYELKGLSVMINGPV